MSFFGSQVQTNKVSPQSIFGFLMRRLQGEKMKSTAPNDGWSFVEQMLMVWGLKQIEESVEVICSTWGQPRGPSLQKMGLAKRRGF